MITSFNSAMLGNQILETNLLILLSSLGLKILSPVNSDHFFSDNNESSQVSLVVSESHKLIRLFELES